MTNYSIHPSIGIARLGNSKEAFYLAPETTGLAPRQCDAQGNPEFDENKCPLRVTKYKDEKGAIKRQAAQFQIIVTDEHGNERPLKKGDMIYGNGSEGRLKDIEWTVYPANKKAVWYQFQQLEGEHGYAADAPLRNSEITDSDLRQQLIIDPGPQTISSASCDTAQFAKGANYGYTQSFPEHLEPNNIDTLGEIRTNECWDLIFLGGHGNSGSYKKGFGHPVITEYANNDGWFDDTSDGPVSARLVYYDKLDLQERYLIIEHAWVITGYPAYAPEITDLITMDDLVYDLMLRNFAYDPYIYGTGNFNDDSKREQPQTSAELEQWRLSPDLHWNPDYCPNFCKDIFPILLRPYYMRYVTTIMAVSSDPHEIGEGGNFDPKQIGDPSPEYRPMREFVYQLLRKPNQENIFVNTGRTGSKTYNQSLMPLLSGDNPITNTLPSKFLKLTDYQLFILRQWKDGKFINDCMQYIDENGDCPTQDTHLEDRGEGLGRRIDRGVLGNILGGAFCPGGEVGWIMRNPAIYKAPFQLNVNLSFVPSMSSQSPQSAGGDSVYDVDMSLSQTGDLSSGLEPGDLTKYMALPWQSDFNECSTQDINVTYTEWNQIYPQSTGDDYAAKVQMNNTTLWWPAHRPMQVILRTTDQETTTDDTSSQEGTDQTTYTYSQPLDWTYGIPQTNAGDLKMVQAWKELGFVVANAAPSDTTIPPSAFIVDGDEPSNLNHDDGAEFGGE